MFCFFYTATDHTPGSCWYCKFVWSNAAILLINPEPHQSYQRQHQTVILFSLETFLYPVMFINSALSVAAQMYRDICCSGILCAWRHFTLLTAASYHFKQNVCASE